VKFDLALFVKNLTRQGVQAGKETKEDNKVFQQIQAQGGQHLLTILAGSRQISRTWQNTSAPWLSETA